MRFDFFMVSYCSLESSGNPYAQSSSTLKAVEASIMTVLSLSGSRRPTAFTEAASGRQRMTASASLMSRFRVASSLRSSKGAEMISRSSLSARRSRTCRPVVPTSPSIKTFFPQRPVNAGRRTCGGGAKDDTSVASAKNIASAGVLIAVIIAVVSQRSTN